MTMVLFHTFLFMFSLRLGVIIIGTLALIKSGVWLILVVWGLECVSQFADYINKILEHQPLFSSIVDWFQLQENLNYYLIGLATFYSLNILICICLLIGAYQCKSNFIYPFLLFHILYTICLCMDMALLYLIITSRNDGLEITIMYFSAVFFVIVYCIYEWSCVCSFIEVIKILQKQVLLKISREALKQVGLIPRRTPFIKHQ